MQASVASNLRRVGTRMNTSADTPYLDCAYKLEEYAGRARLKRSEGKATWPGRKQVHRRYAADATLAGDVVALAEEPQQGQAQLVPVTRRGHVVAPPPSVHDAPAPLRGPAREPSPVAAHARRARGLSGHLLRAVARAGRRARRSATMSPHALQAAADAVNRNCGRFADIGLTTTETFVALLSRE
jgi:nicotinate phosphoribosyltransferase